MSGEGSESQPIYTQTEPETGPDPNLNPPTYTHIKSQPIPSPELETPPEVLPESQPETDIDPDSQPTYSPLKSQESPPPEIEPESQPQPEPGSAGDDAKVGDEATGESVPVEEKKGEVNRTLTMRELLDELKTEEQTEGPASATPLRSFLENYSVLCVRVLILVLRLIMKVL